MMRRVGDAVDSPSWRASRGPVLFLSLLGALLLLLPVCRAAGPVIATIDEIRREGLYREGFSLRQGTDVLIEAVGSGRMEGGDVFAYPWILDLRSRTVVWQMTVAEARATRTDLNIAETAELHLPAGDYALYFSAYGGVFPVVKKIRFLKIFDFGSIEIDGKFPVQWDEYGDPSEWQAVVRAAREDFPRGALADSPQSPDLGAILRFERVGDTVYRCAALDLSEPVRMRVLAIGEYAGSGRGFCDGAWILDRDECRRVWEMTLENTAPAGGAEKNRRFDGEITLGPGRFLACYGSDDSHSHEEWNGPPPLDPESWGLTLIPCDFPAPGVARVVLDPPDENVIVRIAGVGDSAYRREGFTLTHPADFCIRALGEKAHREDRMVDFGWIEDANTLETVWSMEHDIGVFAAGEYRNRLIEDRVHLEPGSYLVCYVTDDTHSPARWRDHPPFDPAGWGIAVRGAGRDFSMDWVDSLDESVLDRTVISLAPMRDSRKKSVRFEVKEPTTVKLIAIGEGGRSEMFDYGWLTRPDTGETVWRMKYADTHHAGGARKNRRVERILELQPGRYALHYVTDDSHAFGDWNADAPDEQHRWGITLIELP